MEMFYSMQALRYCGCDHAAEVASVLGGLTFLHFEHCLTSCVSCPLFIQKEGKKKEN